MAVKAATDRDIEYIISSAHASRPAEFAEFPRRSRCSSTAACATRSGHQSVRDQHDRGWDVGDDQEHGDEASFRTTDGELDPEDSVRFYALRLHDVGMITASPNAILAEGIDWRFLNELECELKA